MKQPGVPLSRAQIEESLAGAKSKATPSKCIHSLRRKIGTERIRNVRGVGYMVSAST